MLEEKMYAVLEIKINKKVYYCVWYIDDIDGMVTEDNQLKWFFNLADLDSYCKNNDIPLDICDKNLYDIDEVMRWLNENINEIDCDLILNTWNITQDLAYSINEEFYGNEKKLNNIYTKLFHGNNLPSMNTSGKMYIPEWGDEEIEEIARVMEDCIRIFKKGFEIL